MARKKAETDNSSWSLPFNLFIPRCGTKLKLVADWKFRLFKESRNSKLFDASVQSTHWTNEPEWSKRKIVITHKDGSTIEIPAMNRGGSSLSVEVTLPAGTVLKVARIYIKQESSTERGLNKGGEFNSVTFTIVRNPAKKFKVYTPLNGWMEFDYKSQSGRFWVKLADANAMQVQCETGTVVSPVDTTKDVKTGIVEQAKMIAIDGEDENIL